MSFPSLILAGLRHHWRAHLGVVLGAAVGAMVILGALIVGDSVRATLSALAERRIGGVDYSLSTGDRFFRQSLAEAFTKLTPDGREAVAPAILLPGAAARPDGSARANDVQVLGVTPAYSLLSPAEDLLRRADTDPILRDGLVGGPDWPADGLAVNETLARRLQLKMGDALIVRVEQPGALSRDAPLSGSRATAVPIRGRVARIVSADDFGDFSLQSGQLPPANVFVPLELLQQRLGELNSINLLLLGVPAPLNGRLEPTELGQKLAENWTLADAGLGVRKLHNRGQVELTTSRIFLPPAIESAARRAGSGANGVLSYFVNALKSGDNVTPYSVVTAVERSPELFGPEPPGPRDLVANQWLAEDLGLQVGDPVTIDYFVLGERGELIEREAEFTVARIVPMEGAANDARWMPAFPGLVDAENCGDWDPGIPIDLELLRDKDQEYWDEFRGTPKAFIPLAAGRELWGNRWGELTSVRYPARLTTPEAVGARLRGQLQPGEVGLVLEPTRALAEQAARSPIDFGQLFLAFSFFLLIAAATLTALLFTFSVEQRNREAGTLLAVGFRPRTVRRLLLAEGLALAAIGTLLGLLAALAYTRLVLLGLGTIWNEAVGLVDFRFAATPESVLGGMAASLLLAFGAMWLATRRQSIHSARALLAGEADLDTAGLPTRRRGPSWSFVLGLACLAGAALLPMLVLGGDQPRDPGLMAGVFFGLGFLLLAAGLCFAALLLRLTGYVTRPLHRLAGLGWRNVARRRGRSLATAGILSAGVFMVMAVSAFRQSPGAGASPGTGGFNLVASSSLPLYDDLGTRTGQEALGLSATLMKDVRAVSFRVRPGDDASCLNLNRAMEPRLLGVRPADLMPSTFRFTGAMGGLDKDRRWELLNVDDPGGEGALPVIADQNTLIWALGKQIGDVLPYVDERGRQFNVRIVATVGGSLLQGSLLIADDQLAAKYPSLGGERFFLLHVPPPRLERFSVQLSRALEDYGWEMVPAAQRLAEFQAVENTYISIFQMLGGLGLVLGSAGLGVVLARNLNERRREFALMEAVGFTAQRRRRLALMEAGWLGLGAVGLGTLTAALAVLPTLTREAAATPWGLLVAILAATLLAAMLSGWAATRWALRGGRIEALRTE
ncbi:MAG: FtsX-like permease family protein [Verrucomicrobiota bacterium]